MTVYDFFQISNGITVIHFHNIDTFESEDFINFEKHSIKEIANIFDKYKRYNIDSFQFYSIDKEIHCILFITEEE